MPTVADLILTHSRLSIGNSNLLDLPIARIGPFLMMLLKGLLLHLLEVGGADGGVVVFVDVDHDVVVVDGRGCRR